MKSAYLLIPVMLLAGCSSLTPKQDPQQLQLTDVEARLGRIEKVINNDSLLQLANDVSDLQNQVKTLRGEVETLRHDTQDAANRQRDLYLDVDRRLQALEQGRTGAQQPALGASAGATQQFGQTQQPAPQSGSVANRETSLAGQGGQPSATGQSAGGGTAPAEGNAAAQSTPAGGDQAQYDAAFKLIQDRHYAEAANAFQHFLAMFPASTLADNAQYWLAETYYVRSQFQDALGQFQKVVDNYPQSAKVADALLKVGYCNYELKHWDAARTALERVTRDYPNTTAARLAAQRLDRIAQGSG